MRRATSVPYNLKGKFLGKIERQVDEMSGRDWFYAVLPDGNPVKARDRQEAQKILREKAGLK